MAGSAGRVSPWLTALRDWKSLPDRSKQCAIVYIGVAMSNHENDRVLSSDWMNFMAAITARGSRRIDRVCSFYEQDHFDWTGCANGSHSSWPKQAWRTPVARMSVSCGKASPSSSSTRLPFASTPLTEANKVVASECPRSRRRRSPRAMGFCRLRLLGRPLEAPLVLTSNSNRLRDCRDF
jgi:hypothetical protein